MAAILDLSKLGRIPYLGFNKTFDMLFDVYIWNLLLWSKLCCNWWWAIPLYKHWTMYTVVLDILMIDGIYMLTRERPN